MQFVVYVHCSCIISVLCSASSACNCVNVDALCSLSVNLVLEMLLLSVLKYSDMPRWWNNNVWDPSLPHLPIPITRVQFFWNTVYITNLTKIVSQHNTWLCAGTNEMYRCAVHTNCAKFVNLAEKYTKNKLGFSCLISHFSCDRLHHSRHRCNDHRAKVGLRLLYHVLPVFSKLDW